MTEAPRGEPLRLEHAMRLLPDIEALAPLRALIASSSNALRFRDEAVADPNGTIARRFVQPLDLRSHIPAASARLSEHFAKLYGAAVEVLEAEQRGDLTGTVAALLRGGEVEEHDVARSVHAFQWYAHALGVAETLRDRRPEIRALHRIGRLELGRSSVDAAARAFQRSLALAEAEMWEEGAALACLGLGECALAHAKWQGAEAWLTRGLRHAPPNAEIAARITLALGEAARGNNDFDAARERLSGAAAMFQALGDRDGVVRTLHATARLAHATGRAGDAIEKLRLALAEGRRGGMGPALELMVRLGLGELHLDAGRLREAEDELRLSESLAISNHFTDALARLYVSFGKLRARQGDENGFVFFEQALALSRASALNPRLEADICLEYARFRVALAEHEEASVYFERARELFEQLGDDGTLRRIRTEQSQYLSR
ncbi:MAG: hypothetical protein L0Z55_04870 [Planctomycetes bacterium]|nr:hypothetical protein [Planctomycetota bacterium]